MDKMRTAFCLLLLLAAAALIYAYYVFAPAHNWDETFHVKSSLVSPSVFDTPGSYGYATDHPSIKRYVYRWVLHRYRVYELDVPDVDYAATQEWNVEAGRVPPLDVTILLRLTNACFAVGALVLVFFSALLILRNAWTALAVVVPLLLSEHIALGVVAYLGCDAILAFTIALALFVFVVLIETGRASTLMGLWLLGVTGALAVSTKFNGALVIVGFCLYLIVSNRGVDRLVKPLIAGLVCAGLFIALNPVVRGGGLDYALGVIWDMLGRRGYIWEAQFAEFPLSRASLVARFFPWMVFLVPLAGALVTLRRERWVAPVSLWCAVLVVGTLASANRTYARYFLPVEMATFFLAGVAAWRLIQTVRARGCLPASQKARKWPIAAAAAVAACVLLALSMAVIVPLGSMRVHGGSLPGKARLFYDQARACYGAGQPVPPAQAYDMLRLESVQSQAAPPARPLVGPLSAKVLASALLASTLVALVFFLGRNLNSLWLGVIAASPFVWTLAVDDRYQAVSVSDALLALSACVTIRVLSRMPVSREPSWRAMALAAFFAALACAASPCGLLVVAVAAACLASAGVRGASLRAAGVVVTSIALFALLEPLSWRLGAGETSQWIMSMRSGSLRLWLARFEDTNDLLLPLNECFPWWPMLPIAVAAILATRKYPWNRALALWLVMSVSAAFLAAGSKLVWRPYMDLVFSVVGGMSGLALVTESVMLRIQFRDEAPQA